LSDYKLTDVRIQSFQNQLDFNQSSNRNKSLSDDTDLRGENNMNINYNGNYSLYLNTRPLQRETSVNFKFKGYRYKVNNPTLIGQIWDNKYYEWETGVNFKDVHRRYVNDKCFIENQFLGSYSFDQYNRFDSHVNGIEVGRRLSNNNHMASVGLPVKVGLGRLERVEDARQALFLIEELSKVNRIQQDVSQESYLALSAFVSKLRNKRFFDVRLQRIYQLEAIDSFLQANQLTTETDAAYFTTTMDYWMFGGQPIRLNGRRISLAFYPSMAYQDNQSAELSKVNYNKNRQLSRYYQAFFALEFAHEKAFKQKWQSSFNTSLSVGKRKTEETIEFVLGEQSTTEVLPSVQFEASYQLGFYPSTRTSMFWNVNVHASKISNAQDYAEEIYGFELERNIFSSSINVNYYVSPRFRIAADLSTIVTRIPTFRGQIFYDPRLPYYYNQTVEVSDSYYQPQDVISDQGTQYNLEERNVRTFLRLWVLYSLF